MNTKAKLIGNCTKHKKSDIINNITIVKINGSLFQKGE